MPPPKPLSPFLKGWIKLTVALIVVTVLAIIFIPHSPSTYVGRPQYNGDDQRMEAVAAGTACGLNPTMTMGQCRAACDAAYFKSFYAMEAYEACREAAGLAVLRRH